MSIPSNFNHGEMRELRSFFVISALFAVKSSLFEMGNCRKID